MAFAAVEVSAALLLFLWGWGDIRRDALALQLAFLLVGYSVTAGLFLFAGRRRPAHAAAGRLLPAAGPFVFLGLLLELPPTEPFGIAAAGYPYVFPSLFAPVCLWDLRSRVSPCAPPNPARRPRAADGPGQLGGRLRPVGRERGGAGAHAGGLRGPRALLARLRRGHRHLDPVGAGGGRGGAAACAHGPGRGSQTRGALRHRVPDGLSALHHAIEAFSPGSSLADFGWSPVLLAAQPLRFPRGSPCSGARCSRCVCRTCAKRWGRRTGGCWRAAACPPARRPSRRGRWPGWRPLVRTARWARWPPTPWCSRLAAAAGVRASVVISSPPLPHRSHRRRASRTVRSRSRARRLARRAAPPPPSPH